MLKASPSLPRIAARPLGRLAAFAVLVLALLWSALVAWPIEVLGELLAGLWDGWRQVRPVESAPKVRRIVVGHRPRRADTLDEAFRG
jgi:hypothetical protein